MKNMRGRGRERAVEGQSRVKDRRGRGSGVDEKTPGIEGSGRREGENGWREKRMIEDKAIERDTR